MGRGRTFAQDAANLGRTRLIGPTGKAALSFSRHLAVFGTASDVGKSLVATAFCRLLSDAGYRVAPFKAQNMSNNASVASDGGEIGRAQYVQAMACRVEPSVHHNPVLLKPTTERSSQIVVRGRVLSNASAQEYYARAKSLAPVAFESLHLLEASHDVLVLEGAGSCAEVNLREREFVNFPAAHAANARVVLVADIERGGVFAQVVGSLELLRPEDRARVCGILVNKFRGDPTLFDDGVRFLESRTGLPVLGVLPYLPDLDIDGEDSLNLNRSGNGASYRRPVAVLCYPHIANFTDFDALSMEALDVHYIRHRTSLKQYSVVVLPGSKAVGTDLAWLRLTGLDAELSRFAAAGGKILGICGGMQMLGSTIADPHHVESETTQVQGLGLLELATEFRLEKTVRRSRGKLCPATLGPTGESVDGYEIHHGASSHAYPSLLELRDESHPSDAPFLDGVCTPQIWGTYLHGLFDSPSFRHAFVTWAFGDDKNLDERHRRDVLDAEINRFSAHVLRHLDWSLVLDWVGR